MSLGFKGSKMVSFMLIFIMFFPAYYALDKNCPSQENIAPLCICKDLGNGPMMLCNNVMNADDLIPPMHQTQNHDMFSLLLQDSSLLYIPKRLFKKTHFKKIRLAGTQLMSLAEDDLAFEGLEDTLEEFRVTDAHYITQWSWSHLRNLHALEMIDVDWVSLGSVSEPLPKLKSLRTFGLSRADISYIVKDAFQGLENIRLMVLKDNDINYLRRSMFPDPATSLMILDLSKNKLNSLPGDMFESMPNLLDVNLDDNNFVTLTEAPFSKLFATVTTFSLKGNNMRCDCRLRWITNARMPMEFNGACLQPENLKGWNMKYLAIKDLWC